MDKIKCKECGWIGTYRELGADYFSYDGPADEVWSNHICPKCNIWGDEDSYEEVKDETKPTAVGHIISKDE